MSFACDLNFALLKMKLHAPSNLLPSGNLQDPLISIISERNDLWRLNRIMSVLFVLE